MLIDDTLLAKLEKLSYVKIADEKREEVKEQLASILSFVENLGELDEKLASLTSSHDVSYVHLRADVPVSSEVGKDIFAVAPKTEENFFIVPKIIE